jgi:hypothetical protein
MGYGGQLIQVIPDLDLVVVITSDADQGRRNAADLVGAMIAPAVTGWRPASPPGQGAAAPSGRHGAGRSRPSRPQPPRRRQQRRSAAVSAEVLTKRAQAGRIYARSAPVTRRSALGSWPPLLGSAPATPTPWSPGSRLNQQPCSSTTVAAGPPRIRRRRHDCRPGRPGRRQWLGRCLGAHERPSCHGLGWREVSGGLGLSMQASGGWANLPATTRPPQRCSLRPPTCR